MRGRTLVALAALAVIDVAVLAVGYRAHTGTLPPMQRSSESFEVSETPTAEPTGSPADDNSVTGPVLLGVNARGNVLRATRGACEERFDKPARLWAGRIEDDVALPVVDPPPGLREVLGLMVYANGSLRVSGLDEDCESVTFDSTDVGASWQASDDDLSLWRLPGDTTASTVTTPRGEPVPAPCAAVQIVNLLPRRAIASCPRLNYFSLAAGKAGATLTAENYLQLSVAAGPDDESYFVLGTTDDCTASVAISTPETDSVDELECFDDDKAPLAIASAGGLLVVQLGNDLLVSDDDGETFETLGEPSPVEESAAAAS
jgi:hypothetical protein